MLLSKYLRAEIYKSLPFELIVTRIGALSKVERTFLLQLVNFENMDFTIQYKIAPKNQFKIEALLQSYESYERYMSQSLIFKLTNNLRLSIEVEDKTNLNFFLKFLQNQQRKISLSLVILTSQIDLAWIKEVQNNVNVILDVIEFRDIYKLDIQIFLKIILDSSFLSENKESSNDNTKLEELTLEKLTFNCEIILHSFLRKISGYSSSFQNEQNADLLQPILIYDWKNLQWEELEMEFDGCIEYDVLDKEIMGYLNSMPRIKVLRVVIQFPYEKKYEETMACLKFSLNIVIQDGNILKDNVPYLQMCLFLKHRVITLQVLMEYFEKCLDWLDFDLEINFEVEIALGASENFIQQIIDQSNNKVTNWECKLNKKNMFKNPIITFQKMNKEKGTLTVEIIYQQIVIKQMKS